MFHRLVIIRILILSILIYLLYVNSDKTYLDDGLSNNLTNLTKNINLIASVTTEHHQQHNQSVKRKSLLINTSKRTEIIIGSIYANGHMILNSQLCKNYDDPLILLIIITSAVPNYERRLAIRKTWGNYTHRSNIEIAFILGKTLDQKLENLLSIENNLYGDLIRGKFIDSYNNLTFKTISMLEWVDKKCPHASFILKTDDDMFINVPILFQFIDKYKNHKNVIFGSLAKKWKPIRNKKSKYYVSPEQFIGNIYPEFTTGPAYLMSSDIIHNLYIKSLEYTYLKLEDVFITGIIAEQLGIKRVNVYKFINHQKSINLCNIHKMISIHNVKSKQQFRLQKIFFRSSITCQRRCGNVNCNTLEADFPVTNISDPKI